jgi:enoyl-CoA hydratase/carnithine racemase
LPALVGEAMAKEMLFTGRRVPATEALGRGLVSRVVAADGLLAAGHAMLDQCAEASPLALRLTKVAVDAPAAAHPYVDLVSQAVLFEDDEKRARMTAFLDRRDRS